MNSFQVSDLKEEDRFTEDVMLDNTFLLLSRGAKVQKGLIAALKDWQFTEVYSNGTQGIPGEISSNVVKQPTAGPVRFSSPVLPNAMEEVSMEEMGIEDVNGKKGKAPGFDAGDIETKFDFSHIADGANRLNVVQHVYDDFMGVVFDVYTHYATHKDIDLEALSQKVKELCIFVRANRRHVLQVRPNKDKNPKNFLIAHSLRSTVLAIAVGLQLHMSITKLTELGVACVLHEIGMIRIPSQLYLSQRNLSPVERNLLNTHPFASYSILKDLEAPLNVCLAVLEHHEKEDGTGYPRRIRGEKISLYAKIVSVVCSFEAITAPRTYKAAASSFEAMVELLKNQTRQYDELVVKALLYSLSLFPVGSYVFLSNGKAGQVVDVNPENPKHPVVQLAGERDESGKPVTVKTSDSGPRIVRAMSKQEIADIVRVMGGGAVGRAQEIKLLIGENL